MFKPWLGDGHINYIGVSTEAPAPLDYFALYIAFLELMNSKRFLSQDILMYKNLFDIELTLRIEWIYNTFHTLGALSEALKWIKTWQGPSVLNSLQCS